MFLAEQYDGYRQRWIYRYYGFDGTLLYVGQTVDLDRRDSEHRDDSEWYEYVDKRTVQDLGVVSEADCDAVERKAIESECPVFNQQHNENNPIAALNAVRLARGTYRPTPVWVVPAILGFILFLIWVLPLIW